MRVILHVTCAILQLLVLLFQVNSHPLPPSLLVDKIRAIDTNEHARYYAHLFKRLTKTIPAVVMSVVRLYGTSIRKLGLVELLIREMLVAL